MALDTHTKKMNPPSIILVHGKACWLISYKYRYSIGRPIYLLYLFIQHLYIALFTNKRDLMEILEFFFELLSYLSYFSRLYFKDITINMILHLCVSDIAYYVCS